MIISQKPKDYELNENVINLFSKLHGLCNIHRNLYREMQDYFDFILERKEQSRNDPEFKDENMKITEDGSSFNNLTFDEVFSRHCERLQCDVDFMNHSYGILADIVSVSKNANVQRIVSKVNWQLRNHFFSSFVNKTSDFQPQLLSFVLYIISRISTYYSFFHQFFDKFKMPMNFVLHMNLSNLYLSTEDLFQEMDCGLQLLTFEDHIQGQPPTPLLSKRRIIVRGQALPMQAGKLRKKMKIRWLLLCNDRIVWFSFLSSPKKTGEKFKYKDMCTLKDNGFEVALIYDHEQRANGFTFGYQHAIKVVHCSEADAEQWYRDITECRAAPMKSSLQNLSMIKSMDNVDEQHVIPVKKKKRRSHSHCFTIKDFKMYEPQKSNSKYIRFNALNNTPEMVEQMDKLLFHCTGWNRIKRLQKLKECGNSILSAILSIFQDIFDERLPLLLANMSCGTSAVQEENDDDDDDDESDIVKEEEQKFDDIIIDISSVKKVDKNILQIENERLNNENMKFLQEINSLKLKFFESEKQLKKYDSENMDIVARNEFLSSCLLNSCNINIDFYHQPRNIIGLKNFRSSSRGTRRQSPSDLTPEHEKYFDMLSVGNRNQRNSSEGIFGTKSPSFLSILNTKFDFSQDFIDDDQNLSRTKKSQAK